MIQKIARPLAETKYIRDILDHPTDLSEFRERPKPRLIAGLIMMGFSYIIGWPAIAALSILAVYWHEPLIAVIGGPATYGLSCGIFLVGAWLARAPHYLGVLTRYATGKFFLKLLGREASRPEEPLPTKNNLTDPETPSGWDFFHRCYCVSLRTREDRRQSALREFSKVGLGDRVEFVLGERHPYYMEEGVYESHMLCLRKGLEAGAENIVIFEDDVEFDRFDMERLRSCTKFLKQHPEWKVFLIGALIRSSRKTSDSCVQEVRYQSLTHAYALNRHYAETLAYEPWQGIVNDTLFRPLTNDVYAIYPMCAFQKYFTSDNHKYPMLVIIRRLFGGLKRIQKAIEFYHRHKTGIYAAHVLFLLFLLAFFLHS
jgi:hypothetical protein